MQLSLDLIAGFLEPEEREPLCWTIDDRNEDHSIIAGNHRSFHGHVIAASKEQFEALPHFVFDP